MGKRAERRGTDGLLWYEIMMCCCKCRAECQSCVVIMLLFYIPIILMLALTAACITIGNIWRNECSYQNMIPYWVIISSVTPYPLFICVKGIAEDYYGVTFWRSLSLSLHIAFTAWLIFGSSWIFDMWMNTENSQCDIVMRYFSFCLVLVHWFIFLISTIGQIVIVAKMCCCGAENAIKPLKGKLGTEGDDLELGE